MLVSCRSFFPHPVFISNFSSVRLYPFRYSLHTESRVYPAPGLCSSASQPSRWRRAPVASLEGFLLRSTQSKWFYSCRIAIHTQLPTSPTHFTALLPLANSWISIAVFVDVSITYVVKRMLRGIRVYVLFRLSLLYFLRRSKTGFRSGYFPIIYQVAV